MKSSSLGKELRLGYFLFSPACRLDGEIAFNSPNILKISRMNSGFSMKSTGSRKFYSEESFQSCVGFNLVPSIEVPSISATCSASSDNSFRSRLIISCSFWFLACNSPTRCFTIGARSGSLARVMAISSNVHPFIFLIPECPLAFRG